MDPARRSAAIQTRHRNQHRRIDRPVGVPRAIREIVQDTVVTDREALRKVEAPTLLICRHGDVIHPAEVGELLNELIPDLHIRLRTSLGINGAGQILCSEGQVDQERAHAFVLTPR